MSTDSLMHIGDGSGGSLCKVSGWIGDSPLESNCIECSKIAAQYLNGLIDLQSIKLTPIFVDGKHVGYRSEIIKREDQSDQRLLKDKYELLKNDIALLKKIISNAKEDFSLWTCRKCMRLCFPGHICYECGQSASEQRGENG